MLDRAPAAAKCSRPGCLPASLHSSRSWLAPMCLERVEAPKAFRSMGRFGSLRKTPGRRAFHPRRRHANAQVEAGPLPASASGTSAALLAKGPCERAPECSQARAARVELHRLGPRRDGQRHVIDERVAGQAIAEEETEA
eukprot:8986985-Pyramimonas_sp.AAC.1